MAEGDSTLGSERELLDSLSKKRRAFKESFKLKPLKDGEDLETTDGGLQTTSSFVSDDLLDTMRARRVRRRMRKGELPPLDVSALGLKTLDPAIPPTNPILTSTLNEEAAAGVSSIRKLRERQDQRTRFDDLTISNAEPPNQRRPVSPVSPRSVSPPPPPPPPLSSAGPSQGITAKLSSERWRLLSLKMTETKDKVKESSSMEFFLGSSPVHEEVDEGRGCREDTDHHEAAGTDAPVGFEGRGLEEEEPLREREGRGEEEVHVAQQRRGEEEGDIQREEERTMLVEQEGLFGLEANVKRVQEYGFPKYLPYQEKTDREKDIYFIPSRVLAPLETKTPDQAPPIFDEDAGLYVGQRPKVSIGNLATMENRLLRRPDKGKGWFGKDGLLLTTPEPTQNLLTRPPIIAEDPNRHLIFRQPRQAEINTMIFKKTEGVEDCQLKIFLGIVKFSHHPLFSREHVLSERLMEQCKQYHKTDRGRLIEQYREQLRALQYTIQDLKQAGAESAQSSEQLQRYCTEVRAKRQQLKQTSAREYQLMQNILKTWREMKQLRDEQGFSCTTSQLIIHKVATDEVAEQTLLERDIESELVERREDYEASMVSDMLQYQEELAEWKAYNKARKRTVREQSRKESTVSQPSSGAESTTNTEPADTLTASNSTSAIIVPPKRPRPTAPPSFDEAGTRLELAEYYRVNHRKPGDPQLIPQLTQNHPITQNIPREEQRRRDSVDSTRYKIKVLYNGKEVYISNNDKYLTSDFSVIFDELLTVQIVEVPHCIELVLINSSSRISSSLAHIYVPIPDSTMILSTSTKEVYQFSSNQQINYDHSTAVGTGHTHPLLPEFGELVTSGHMTLLACWAEDEDGRPLCPPGINNRERGSQLERIARVGVTGVNNVHRIKKWIEEANLDPNDPRNWELLELVESIPSAQEDNKYFRLDKLDDDARFIDEEEYQNNRRFTLLKLRDQGHPTLKGQCIPMNEEGISDSLWKSVNDYKPYSLAELPVSIFGNFYDGRREQRLVYLNDVREKVLKRAGSHLTNQLTLEDVIHEEVIPNITTLGKTLWGFFAPRRPLKPVRTVRRKPKPQNVHVETCQITVRVVRAVNVPVREEQLRNNEVLVQSFAEVRFGKEFSKTASAHGPHPHWNEELTLPFHPPDDDFSPLALQKISDELEIHLYDEITVDISVDEAQRHQRLEKKWLGSLTIPFSTLHDQTRIEGTFQLNTPLVLLGYTAPPTNSTLSSESSNTYIQLYISLEPPLSMLPPISDKFDSVEDSFLLEKGRVWLKNLRDKFPNRNYTATVLDSNGKNVFVTRFIRPQNPPASLLPADHEGLSGGNLLQCMERLAWFVSLIPFLPDAILFSGTCDIWFTSDIFLHMLGGDEEEHAVLLCNYFLFLGKKAWVVLGTAIPEGPTAYVLTPHPVSRRSYILWNPSTGKHFPYNLSHIPLHSIGCLINNENVWGNVQEWDHPGRLTFDLQNCKKWCPLFSSSVKPLDSLQVDVLEYSETDPDQVQQLRTRIDRLVHDHIEQLREHDITRWNRLCCRLLQRLSTRLEEKPFSSNEVSQEHKRELKESLPGYKITGYPLHIMYSDTAQLLRAVEATGLHLCHYRRVEFAMYVTVHSYPNDILSVWLYLATVIPPDTN